MNHKWVPEKDFRAHIGKRRRYEVCSRCGVVRVGKILYRARTPYLFELDDTRCEKGEEVKTVLDEGGQASLDCDVELATRIMES
jgi:hypothetical protein